MKNEKVYAVKKRTISAPGKKHTDSASVIYLNDSIPCNTKSTAAIILTNKDQLKKT
jgi:hypothetical protein